jgi:hypothetical protein
MISFTAHHSPYFKLKRAVVHSPKVPVYHSIVLRRAVLFLKTSLEELIMISLVNFKPKGYITPLEFP